MEPEDNEYMNKISNKLHQLGLPNTPENKIFCMLFNEIREINNNMEMVINYLKEIKRGT